MHAIALVVPCYNEARRIDAEAFATWIASRPDALLVLVDDGSRDGTRAVLERIATRAPQRVRVVALQENRGKAEAVRAGVSAALSHAPTRFGYWDADLSTPLEEVAAMERILDERPALQAVVGARVKLLGRDVRRSALRHYLGRVFATCASVVLDLGVYDTQCGAKLFRNGPGTRALFRRPFLSRWLFDVEILARLGRLARRRSDLRPAACVHEHVLSAWHDVAGSKLSPLDAPRAAYELVRIALLYRRRRPRPGSRAGQ